MGTGILTPTDYANGGAERLKRARGAQPTVPESAVKPIAASGDIANAFAKGLDEASPTSPNAPTGPAIVASVVNQLAGDARALVGELREDEASEAHHTRALTETRAAAEVRRRKLGDILLRARAALPKRGTKETGWGAFLKSIDVDEATAYRYMELAKAAGAVFHGGDVKDSEPSSTATSSPTTYRELDMDNRARASDEEVGEDLARAPNDPHAPLSVERDATPSSTTTTADAAQPKAQPHLAPTADRDTWVTPKWLADAVGNFDLDPCTNERSHVQAATKFMLENDQDGLALATDVDLDWRVWINPPYSAGQVIRWVRAYKDTRFCFLVRFDPSTEWFGELYDATRLILIPRGRRIDFEPPHGAESSSNPFPHALFFAHPEDASDEIRAQCFEWLC